jgi:hypothetical protein
MFGERCWPLRLFWRYTSCLTRLTTSTTDDLIELGLELHLGCMDGYLGRLFWLGVVMDSVFRYPGLGLRPSTFTLFSED